MVAKPPKINAVLFEINDKMRMDRREKISRTTPIRAPIKSGSSLIPALSKNGAVKCDRMEKHDRRKMMKRTPTHANGFQNSPDVAIAHNGCFDFSPSLSILASIISRSSFLTFPLSPPRKNASDFLKFCYSQTDFKMAAMFGILTRLPHVSPFL